MTTLDTRQARTSRRSGARIRFTALLALISALVLAGCGADVNTQLSLNDDYSGQRQFILTMAEDDVESLSGGIEAAEQALEIHAPDQLIFEGIEPEEEGYSATFTMSFDDVEEYRQDLTALLDASNVAAADRGMNVEVDEQQLVTSIEFEEDFYNDDLMGWASEALIDEGVVPTNTTVLTSNGAAEVLFDDEEVSTSTSLPRINFSLTDDRRFDELGLDFEIAESGEFRTSMTYLVSPDHTAAQNEFVDHRVEQLNDLDSVDGAVEDSGPVENHGSGKAEHRKVTATFSSAKAVEAGMQILLANEDATFEVADVTQDGSPEVITEYTGSNWSCDGICNPDNMQQLDGETIYPDHWQMIDQRRKNGQFYLEFNRGMPLDSLTSTTRLDLSGGMIQTFEFVVDNKTLDGHEDAITDLFEPSQDSGSLTTESEGGKTIYTTTFHASDAQALTRDLNGYLEDKGITETVSMEHEPLTGIWANYALDIDLEAVWALATGGVDEAATFQVELPQLHSGTAGSATSSGGTIILEESTGNFSVHGSGPTITTMWTAVVLASGVVIGVIVLVLWRRRRFLQPRGSKGTGRSNTPPYNVQRADDDLTESQIYRSPLAPSALGDPTSSTTQVPIIDPKHTLIYNQTRPFPDVPIPSATDYHELQRRTDNAATSAGEMPHDEKHSCMETSEEKDEPN